MPGSAELEMAFKNDSDSMEMSRKLANKKRDYATPQSDAVKNRDTRYGKTFNEMAAGIAQKVLNSTQYAI